MGSQLSAEYIIVIIFVVLFIRKKKKRRAGCAICKKNKVCN